MIRTFFSKQPLSEYHLTKATKTAAEAESSQNFIKLGAFHESTEAEKAEFRARQIEKAYKPPK